MSAEKVHPCIQCGACCASFRVSFSVKETEHGGSWQVPNEMIESSGGDWYSMKGTNKKHRPACNALEGTIGKKVSCQIYESRPSPCRNFLASYEDGIYRARCDEARKKHGLRPLTKENFKDHNNKEEQLYDLK